MTSGKRSFYCPLTWSQGQFCCLESFKDQILIPSKSPLRHLQGTVVTCTRELGGGPADSAPWDREGSGGCLPSARRPSEPRCDVCDARVHLPSRELRRTCLRHSAMPVCKERWDVSSNHGCQKKRRANFDGQPAISTMCVKKETTVIVIKIIYHHSKKPSKSSIEK